MAAYKLYEVTKYTIGLPHFYASFPITINLTSWNSLQLDVQKILADAAQETVDRGRTEKWIPKHAEECFEIVIKNGMIRYELTIEESRGWKNAAKKVHKEYVEEAAR
jgi:TRAP-type C4-dicarboxylate transport system substrate-binding protein